MSEVSIVRLGAAGWERHRRIRLEALRSAPDMYSTRYVDMVDQPESWWRDIVAKNRYFYAEFDGGLVGLAGLATPSGNRVDRSEAANALTEALAEGAGMLISVFVSPKARGQKLGERLSEAVIAQARSEGLKELFLDVAEHNTAAQGVYAKLGFEFTRKSRPTWAQGLAHQELEMRLAL